MFCFFDGAFCHYTLWSKARRVGLVIRLCRGAPVYNGFFRTPSVLDGLTATEFNRRLLQRAFKDLEEGQSVPLERVIHRVDGTVAGAGTSAIEFLIFFGRRLDERERCFTTYAKHIAENLGSLQSTRRRQDRCQD